MANTYITITDELKDKLLSNDLLDKYRKICGYKVHKEEMYNFIVDIGIKEVEKVYREKHYEEKNII